MAGTQGVASGAVVMATPCKPHAGGVDGFTLEGSSTIYGNVCGMTETTELDLETVLANATPAPWWAEGCGGIGMDGKRDRYEIQADDPDGRRIRLFASSNGNLARDRGPDAAAIAALRNAAPSLLAAEKKRIALEEILFHVELTLDEACDAVAEEGSTQAMKIIYALRREVHDFIRHNNGTQS